MFERSSRIHIIPCAHHSSNYAHLHCSTREISWTDHKNSEQTCKRQSVWGQIHNGLNDIIFPYLFLSVYSVKLWGCSKSNIFTGVIQPKMCFAGCWGKFSLAMFQQLSVPNFHLKSVWGEIRLVYKKCVVPQNIPSPHTENSNIKVIPLYYIAHPYCA